jgi:hypothetical protein
MSPEIGMFGNSGPQVMIKAELPKEQESQLLTKAKVWVLKQACGRVQTSSEEITLSVGKVVEGTIQRTEKPKTILCSPRLADGLRKTGLIFSSTAE